jgi:large subunit ribosomal protein L32
MAVPKRKLSRSNTRHRRSQWKIIMPQVNRTVENGRVVWSVSHRARIVTDAAGTPTGLRYNSRDVADL